MHTFICMHSHTFILTTLTLLLAGIKHMTNIYYYNILTSIISNLDIPSTHSLSVPRDVHMNFKKLKGYTFLYLPTCSLILFHSVYLFNMYKF